MTLRSIIENRALQEKYVLDKDFKRLKGDIYLVLDEATAAAARLNQGNPEEGDEVLQDKALRCCFFFLNTIGDRRMKEADVLEESEREKAFASIKEDFELIAKFADSPDYTQQYFFKCGSERVFDLAVMAAISFMGGNPGIERVVEGAENRRMACFDVMMHALELGR